MSTATYRAETKGFLPLKAKQATLAMHRACHTRTYLRSGFAVLILYRSGGSVRISTDLHGSVLGQYWVSTDQYGSVLGQYGSVRISTGSVLGQYGSVWISMDQYGSVWIRTDLYGSIRICTDLYKISTGSVQILTREGEIACIPYKISTKSVQIHTDSVQISTWSNKSVQDQYIQIRSVQISTYRSVQYRSVHTERNQMHSVQNLCTDLVISRTDLVQTRADPYRSVQIRSDPVQTRTDPYRSVLTQY